MLPTPATQLSIRPLFHAACCELQLCGRSPLHWARVSPSAPPAGGVALSFHGYWRPPQLGWLNMPQPPGMLPAARSPKPRTPFSLPK